MNKAMTALVTGMVVAVVVGGAAFYGGMMFQRSQRTRAFAQGGMVYGGPGGFAGRGPASGARDGGFTAGEILSKDEKSITVKMPDGGSKTVYYSSSARITKSTEATATDLAAGTNVIVAGSQGSDGGITARTIQIVPAGMIRQRMVQPGGGPGLAPGN